MIGEAELTSLLDRIDEAESAQGEGLHEVAFGDGNALSTIADVLTTLAQRRAGSSVARPALDQFATWLEAKLAGPSRSPDQAYGDGSAEALFWPFLSATAAEHFLDDADARSSLRVSRDVASAETYVDGAAGAWGPLAWAAATANLPARTPEAEADLVVALIFAIAATCAIPVAAATFPLEAEAAHHFVSATGHTLDRLRSRLLSPKRARSLWATPDMARVRAELDHLLRKKQAQRQVLAARFASASSARVPSAVDRAEADQRAGELIGFRAVCMDLGEQRTETWKWAAKHELTTLLGDKLIINPGPWLQQLQETESLIHEQISRALALAADAPSNVKALDQEVERIALTLDAFHVLLAVIRASEALVSGRKYRDFGTYTTVSALQVHGRNVFHALPFLQPSVLDQKNKETIEGIIADAAHGITVLLTSYRWSHIVSAAMSDATDIIMAIVGGGGMGGVASSFRSRRLAVPILSLGRSTVGALSHGELVRILAGVSVVAMASYQKGTPQWSAHKGRRAERGLGTPRRGREVIDSLMGTAARRILDQAPNGFKGIREIKNVAYLRFTRQLQDLLVYSLTTRRPLTIYVRPKLASGAARTDPSKELKILIKEGLIKVRYLRIF